MPALANLQLTYKYDEINSFRDVRVRRLDWVKAHLVDESVRLQSCQGTDSAAAFLKSEKVDIDVALRVLAHPQDRRN
jgi:hypothetical protein